MFWISQQKVMIRAWDLLAGLFPQKDTYLKRFLPKNKSHITWTSSARHAIYLTIKHIQAKQKDQTKKITIAIPAFTCQVVIEAAKNANAKIIFYDSGVKTTTKDIKQAITQKPDILLLSYNFGELPKNIRQMQEECKKHNIILIEDCAQALGARQEGILAGSWGDFAIYSFGISKNIGITGGLIAAKEQVNIPKKIPKMNISQRLTAMSEAAIAPIALHPFTFSIARFALSSRVHKVKRYPNKQYLLPKYFQNVIKHLAKRYHKTLSIRQKNYKILTGKPTTNAALYFPITSSKRRELITSLAKEKIQIDEMKSFKCFNKSFPNANKTAQEHLTLALYRPTKETKKIKAALKKLNIVITTNNNI